MPKAFVAPDGTIMKACPQCVKDELTVYPQLSHEEAAQRVLRVADEAFCRSARTADGYQSWCKMHINEKNKQRKKLNAEEEEDRKKRQLENAQRSQENLRREAEERRAQWESRGQASIPEDEHDG